jgi:hypothetical protein
MKTMRRAGILAGLVLSALSSPGTAVAGEPVKDPLKDLGWISGDWEMRTEKLLVEERWTTPAGRRMLGGIYYVAQPGGKPPVDFKWNGASSTEVVFENPQHDFPKRIVYRKNADGSVTARVEGGTTGEKAQEFRYARPRS